MAFDTENDVVLVGKDINCTYGNLEKADEASRKAEFIFSEVADRDIIEGLSISLVDGGNCTYSAGSSCVSTATYEIITTEDMTEPAYKWSITAGNASLVNDDWEATIEVQTSDSDQNETFTLQCIVIDDFEKQVTVSSSFTHTKTQV